MTCGGADATRKLRCAVASCDVYAKPIMVFPCNVRVCGTFLGLQSVIAILEVCKQMTIEISILFV